MHAEQHRHAVSVNPNTNRTHLRRVGIPSRRVTRVRTVRVDHLCDPHALRANNVTFEHTTNDPAAYPDPEPSAAVFQPKNVYPDLVGAVDDNVKVEPDVQV